MIGRSCVGGVLFFIFYFFYFAKGFLHALSQALFQYPMNCDLAWPVALALLCCRLVAVVLRVCLCAMLAFGVLSCALGAHENLAVQELVGHARPFGS